MQSGEKISLRYGRKISIGGMITVHIPGLSKFQSIWLWNFNSIWDALCKLCNTQEVLCVLLTLVTLTEKKKVCSWCAKRSESRMKNITSVLWKSLSDYRFLETALFSRLDPNMQEQDSLKGIQINNRLKTYWLLWIAIYSTQRVIASVRGFSVAKNPSWALRNNFVSCLCRSFLWLVECVLKLDKTRFIYK